MSFYKKDDTVGTREGEIMAIVTLLSLYWLQHTQLRFAQIIGNAMGSEDDPYYFEDEALEAWLRKQLRPESHGAGEPQ